MAPREEHRGLPYRYHDYLGLCYRMTELDAAFGLAQLRKLPRWVQQRREAAHLLDELLTDVEGVRPAPIDAQVEHSYWLYPILLDLEQFDCDVYDFAAALCAEGVSGMPKEYFLLYDMPIYQNQTAYAHSHCPWDCPAYGRSVEYHHGLCPNAEDVLARAIALTWHHRLTERDVRLMAGAIRKVADYYRRSA
jgi:dTDP-4-amino-4,6-dideoxygalactose transaminase